MEAILKVQNLKKYYGKNGNITRAVDGIDLLVYPGEFLGIMGASGSGKTTLLNCISTMDSPSDGQIQIGGEDIAHKSAKALARFRRENLGFIFQDFNLLDTLTAYENIALALTINRVPVKEIDARIQKAADVLHITSVLSKYPYQLSGGEKQRVASARAIVTRPKLILADEPTGALDSKSSKALLENFRQMNEAGATILMVTHDAQAASYAGRIIFIKDGRLVHELVRTEETREAFFDRIVDRTKCLGGEDNDR